VRSLALPLPGNEHAFRKTHKYFNDIVDDADNNRIGLQEILDDHDHGANALVSGNQFGSDNCPPAHARGCPKSGEDFRKRIWQNDMSDRRNALHQSLGDSR